jgi:hypothetical protein
MMPAPFDLGSVAMRARFLGAAVAASLLAGPAHATTAYTWDTTGSYTASNDSLVFSAENPSEKVKRRAYQISTLSAGRSFTTATLTQYSRGLGITSTNETTSPTRAIDNDASSPSSGRYEFLLVEFDGANDKNMGFHIRWKQNDPDREVWLDNAAAGLNLTNTAVCGATTTAIRAISISAC